MAGLKEILEGKPLRSPLHPAVVHLPLALFPLSFVLDVATWLLAGEHPGLVRAAFYGVVGGLLTGLLAGVLGMVDYTSIRDDHPAKRTATLHLVLNLIALGVFGASAGLRYGELEAARTPGIALILSVVGLGLLSYSGYLGGHLVYSDGIGVGRHRRKTRLPERTLQSEKTTGAPVAIASEEALREGETLRAEVNGVVIAVARVGGAVHAFQEFCTHRYGPLSEGALRGNEVVCPWHNSRFDVRNGKVMCGPAKVDLKTFPVERRDGKIWVTVAAETRGGKTA